MEGKRGSECLLKSVSNIDFNPKFGSGKTTKHLFEYRCLYKATWRQNAHVQNLPEHIGDEYNDVILNLVQVLL